ncbi:unnamed protein product [Rotaria sp. Silwood1]|nr:unnamed protein product [Rotaria sp. Silwood1]CAF3526929.1 unnamed protein product [Rotaria sp. Silwood1]CAF4925828.1 unnamed protein product [Rotaria sp. Silwood1]
MSTSVTESSWSIKIVNENDLVDLLPLMQAYCKFYNETEQIPIINDDALMSLSRALIANPTHEGIQLIVRDCKEQAPVGFATIFWSWSTLQGGRIAIMNDLYVYEQYRGQGVADILIKECARYAREHGAVCLTWETSIDNKRAQAVYNRTRCLQFLTVFLLVTIFLFSPIVTFITFILLSWFWSLPMTLTIFFIYGCWVYFDRHTDSQGGRWSNRIRRLSIFTQFVNYFPLKLIKSEDLDPNRNYIFGFHPHGAFSLSALGNFGTDVTYFSTLFPNIRSHLMLLHLQFLFPFTRACCVSKDSCEYLLSGKSGQGHALVIIIGGAREMYLTRNDTMILYLKTRKGFVRLALKHGASLVPVISFGENELYQRHAFFNLIPNGIAWGRFLVGHVPLRRPVVTVVGKPIHVQQKVNPTSEDIDQLHHQYIQSVEELFEVNKHKYRLEHVKLEIV